MLSLPAEFASQLPHDGGAFYTTDTIDSSRIHYASRWPTILHATVLWINSCGLLAMNPNDIGDRSLDKEVKMYKNSNLPKENSNTSDRCALLFILFI